MGNRIIKFRTWIPTGYDDDDNPTGYKMIDDLAFEEYLPLNDHLRNFESPLMQFTGLYDKNGKEIFEGDALYSDRILTDEDPPNDRWIVDVTFEDGAFCYGWHGDPLDKGECSTEMEVIGNIYENPELFKGD